MTPNEPLTPTPVSAWKKSSGQASTHTLPLPSGNVALCRRPGIEVFMKLGLIPNSLMAVIQRSIDKAQKGQDFQPDVDSAMDQVLEDPSKLADMLTFVDGVLCFVCVEPKVVSPPASDIHRDPEVLYADEVDLTDKMYVFQWAMGGTESLENFREGLEEKLAAVSELEGVDKPTE